MNDDYKNDWNCIIGYIVLGIILPSAILVFLISSENPEILEKYRDENFVFFEFFDIIRQIGYALASAYDQPIVCITIEVIWVLLICIPRVYDGVSEYFLQGGSSSVVVFSNILSALFKYRKIGSISFNFSLGIIIAASVLAIIPLYIFFIFEFEAVRIEGKDKEKEISSNFVRFIFILISPIFFFIFWYFYSSTC